MRPAYPLSTQALLLTLVAFTVSCAGSLSERAGADQPIAPLALQVIDTTAVGGEFSLSGSASSDTAVGMGFRSRKVEGIVILRANTASPSVQVIPNGLAGSTIAGSSRLVGMGGPTPGLWMTADAIGGEQVLGRLDPSGVLVASVAVTRTETEPIGMSMGSAIAIGRVAADGRFLTPRSTTTEAGSISVGMHSFDTSMRESSTCIGGGSLRGPEGAVISSVGDIDIGTDSQVVCTYGQTGLALIQAGGTSSIVSYLQTPVAPVTHVAAGRTSSEALVLAGSQVLLVNTATGETRAISLGSVPFSMSGPLVRRLFRYGGTGIVVGDAKVVRFDIGTGTLLPDVAFGYGPVVAAEQSSGKLILAHTTGAGGILSWLPLN
jgi:hypothetical protein